MLLNLIKNQRPDIDQIHQYIKDPFKSNNQLLINEREKSEIKKKMQKYLLIIHKRFVMFMKT